MNRLERLKNRIKDFSVKNRPTGKDFTNDDVEFLIMEIWDLEYKVQSLERQLDPDDLNARAMQIIRDAAKYLESRQEQH